MWTEILVISAVTGVLLVFGTLAWWKVGDQWVSEEHRRFKKVEKKPLSGKVVVTKDADAP